MNSIQERIPFYLVYSRIASAVLFIPLYFSDFNLRDETVVGLMLLAIVTDFFDGFIARKWGTSTETLRVWDSNADQVFWLASIACIFLLNTAFLKDNWILILILIALEALTYLISILRFKKTIATHSILAKIWTLTLLLFLIDLTLNHTSSSFFWVCIGLGIISRLEIIGINSALKEWTTDVPSIFHVGRVNRKEAFTKSRWLNS